MPESPFCPHKKLRMSCPECGPAARAAVEATRPPPPPTPPRRSPSAPRDSAPKEPAGPRPLGRPVKRRMKRATAEEADNAEAWWVKK